MNQQLPQSVPAPEMVARFWSARTTAQLSTAYTDYFSQHVLPELRAIHGFVSAQVLTRRTGAAAEVEILVITTWDSFEAIAAFAGADREAAVVHPAAAALLTDYDRRVRHFDVAVSAT
jgi:heme-degrading monooxygenase HmoA